MARTPHDPIEAVSSERRNSNPYDRYADLFELQNHLDEVKNLEIDDIILSVSDKDKANYLARKAAHVNSRALMHQDQLNTSNKKAETYLALPQVFLNTASVVCQVAAISYGPGFTAIGQTIGSSAGYMEKVSSSRLETLGHHYQRTRDLVDDHSRGVQSSDKELDQSLSMVERMIQNSRRQAEMIMGG